MFKCLGWLCPATFIIFIIIVIIIIVIIIIIITIIIIIIIIIIFAFRNTNSNTSVSLRPETRDVATRVSGRKWVQSTELDIVDS